jgi:hypothetical protein
MSFFKTSAAVALGVTAASYLPGVIDRVSKEVREYRAQKATEKKDDGYSNRR